MSDRFFEFVHLIQPYTSSWGNIQRGTVGLKQHKDESRERFLQRYDRWWRNRERYRRCFEVEAL